MRCPSPVMWAMFLGDVGPRSRMESGSWPTSDLVNSAKPLERRVRRALAAAPDGCELFSFCDPLRKNLNKILGYRSRLILRLIQQRGLRLRKCRWFRSAHRGRHHFRDLGFRRLLLWRFLLDVDRAFEICAIFDHDALRRNITGKDGGALQLHAIASHYISVHSAKDGDITRLHIRTHAAVRADGQTVLMQIDA